MKVSDEILLVKQNEDFWKKQYELLKMSGLSRKEYCSQNNLNYDQFGYWISKWNRQGQSEKLIPVELKSKTESVTPTVLCSMDLRNGSCLKIHDIKALFILLEKI